MTAQAGRARLALSDCAHALAMMRSGLKGTDWRIAWLAAVALLRTVGYVLKNVDGARDPSLGRATDAWWDRLKETEPDPAIFWGFIDAERHNILKELEFGARQDVTVYLGHIELDLETGESQSTPGRPATYDHRMGSGPFANKDPRDVVEEAIEWWREQLNAIEEDAKRET